MGISVAMFGLVWSLVLFQALTSKSPEMEAKMQPNIESEIQVVKESPKPVEEELITANTTGLKDLRTVDFSDIDTSTGVPIDVILLRLGIDE